MSGTSHQQLSRRLDGRWLAAPADEALRRDVGADSLDDAGWEPIDVPGHWRSVPAFADEEAVLYRHRFADEAPGPGQRAWLSLDGLCYQGDVWLDGDYLGDTEGYFIQHVFEITDQLASRSEHLVGVEATCRRPRDLADKSNLTGVLQHWDCLDPSLNPGGIWRPVRVERTGPVRVGSLRVIVLEAEVDRAIVRVRAEMDTDATHTVVVRTLVDPAADRDGSGTAAVHDQEHVLARGTNTVEWHVAVEDPRLWWPWSMGDQPLYDLRVEVRLAGQLSHVRKRRFGLRGVELRNWIASVNSRRLHLKGTNLGPTSADLASVTAREHRRDLDLARQLGLNLVRVHGHVAPPDLYREADRAGMLVWQDMPLQWGYSRRVRSQAARQATEAVNQLAHHPSILLWCGHNEPWPVTDPPGVRSDARPTGRFLRAGVRAQQLPSWNRTVLDRTVRRALAGADPSRPAIAHSGVPPHPPQLDGTDSHLYFGWHHGWVGDLSALAVRVPRMVRFVSELGAQAVPDDPALAADIGADRFPDVDWDRLRSVHGAQVDLLRHHCPPPSSANWAEWVAATQRHQADVIRRSIEQLRRLKYRPNGGFCQFMLADAAPYVTASVTDHDRRPKAGVSALAEACRPVIVVADLVRQPVTGPITFRVHVVSDLADPLVGAEVTAAWRGPVGDPLEWRFAGDVDADSVAAVGRLTLDPGTAAGPATLDLTLTAPGVSARNRYDLTLSPIEHT